MSAISYRRFQAFKLFLQSKAYRIDHSQKTDKGYQVRVTDGTHKTTVMFWNSGTIQVQGAENDLYTVIQRWRVGFVDAPQPEREQS